jgi:hypothetical protein
MYTNKEIVYLVGQISIDDPETYEWRRRVKLYFSTPDLVNQIEFIDPCANPFNQEVRKLKGTDSDRGKVYKVNNIEVIPDKDMQYVIRSTIGLMNFNHYDPEKLIIGSWFECAWYMMLNKMVIGIYDGDPLVSQHTAHPFPQRAVTTWVKDDKEACEVLRRYFTWAKNEGI